MTALWIFIGVLFAIMAAIVFALLRISRSIREESTKNRDEIQRSARESGRDLSAQVDRICQQVLTIGNANEERLERIRKAVDDRMGQLREETGKQLENIRVTVDEKLHETLDKRLGESFNQVSQRLEMVHKGLGEMQSLASGVGDLKRVLTNVKTRGVFGEIQLSNLLEELLTPDQYVKNFATRKGSNERVEFAVRLPGREETPVWLPIDSKFPQEDYQRLLAAADRADAPGVEEATKQLVTCVREEAKRIRDKYINPPNTTDFAVLFLPFEGLYAEVLRIPGLHDSMRRDFQIVVTGPTTLSAFLSSLQMGFKTLAIEKRSAEVWALLGAVKTEFGKFGIFLEKTKKKLEEATSAIENAEIKTRKIQSKLKNVQTLAPAAAASLLEADEVDAVDVDDNVSGPNSRISIED